MFRGVVGNNSVGLECNPQQPHKGKIKIYPDPSARQRKTSAGGLTDLAILKNLYSSTGGSNWRISNGWNGPMDTRCCPRYGITCSSDGKDIIKINLPFNYLHGSIPISIQYLSKLEMLSLYKNHQGNSI